MSDFSWNETIQENIVADEIDHPEPRIVCAANNYNDVIIIIGARHYDDWMHAQIEAFSKLLGDNFFKMSPIQGFIDQYGNFYGREEAYKIAKANNQIIRDHHITRKLFSEHLY